jgi:hypothetical protein
VKFKYVRIYADADGESHFEDVEADLKEGPMAARSEILPATCYQFAFTDKGTDFRTEQHPTSNRHMVIVLEGGVSVEASDGEVRWFGPGSPHGHIVLLEDMEGKGHLNRGVNAAPRYTITINLPA